MGQHEYCNLSKPRTKEHIKRHLEKAFAAIGTTPLEAAREILEMIEKETVSYSYSFRQVTRKNGGRGLKVSDEELAKKHIPELNVLAMWQWKGKRRSTLQDFVIFSIEREDDDAQTYLQAFKNLKQI